MMTDAEHEFMQLAELELIACMRGWDAIETPVGDRRRLVIELTLLLKFAILFARDGLGLTDEALLASVLADVWRDEADHHVTN